MNRPAYSFIVPLYNCLELTQAMLASLAATLPPHLPHEVILVDDGSTDGTRAWLAEQRKPHWQVLLNDRNLRYAATNNRGAAAASGEHLILLNNDLVLLPGWFERLVAAHRSLGARAGLIGNVQLDARTAAVDHAGIVFNERAKPEHERRAPARVERWLRPVRKVPAVTAACVMLSAALWRELGGFDEAYRNGGEDIDLCFRARALGRTNAVALRSVVRHVVSASPGRKAHDEANSERLMRRWRAEFIACSTRQWCRDEFERALYDPRDYAPAYILPIWLHARGWRGQPPPAALAGLNRAVDREVAHWESLRAPPQG